MDLPQTNMEELQSDDPNSRKMARRERIAKRDTAENQSNNHRGSDEEELSQLGQQQVADSLSHLDKKKKKVMDRVTSIRVVADERENDRRAEEEKSRQDRLVRLQNEAIFSSRANAAIEMKWNELSKYEIPQDLQADIDMQKESCSEIMLSKDLLIEELQGKLKEKDEEYVTSLRLQAEEIDELLLRKKTEFRDIQREYDRQISSIEDSYLEERELMLKKNQNEVDRLLDQRSRSEVAFLESRQKQEEEFQTEIEELLQQGTEKYNKLKIELETNIQTLKQQLEEIRATYQLNTEKLDYNYRVLTELDLEKTTELARYKRKVTKIKDQMNQYKIKFKEISERDEKTNQELTSDYRSLTQKYKGLQHKFRHFETMDAKKYDDLWRMHDEEMRMFVDRVLAGDRIITEQILGWEWEDPDLSTIATNHTQSQGSKQE